jgi:hypothetical protein
MREMHGGPMTAAGGPQDRSATAHGSSMNPTAGVCDWAREGCKAQE